MITAALVATLSVGTPMAAIASTVSEGGVDMLVATDVDNVLAGQIVEWNDNAGKAMSGTEFVADGTSQYIVPTKVMPLYGDEAVSVDASSYDFVYFVATESGTRQLPDGTKVERISNVDGNTKTAGTYYVGIVSKGTGSNPDVNKMAYLKFTIVSDSLDGARITDTKGDDIDLTYSATKFNLTDNKKYEIRIGDNVVSTDDYTMTVYNGDGSALGADSVKKAGNYIVRLTGKGKYAGQKVDIKVTVNALDLSKANVTVSNQDVLAANSTLPSKTDFDEYSINGESVDSNLAAELSVSFDAANSSDTVEQNGTAGAYAYKVSAKSAENSSITGTASFVVTRYNKAAYFEYDDNAVTSGSTYTVPEDEKFDVNNILVAESNEKNAKAVDFDVTYTNLDDDATVTADQLTVPGNYAAKITAKSSDYKFGGSITVDFRVAASVVDDSSVYVLYKDEVAPAKGITKVYDGKNVMDDIKVTAYDKDKKEIPASELVLTYTNTDTGKEVSEITDAGNYQLKVTLKDDSVYQIVGGDQTVNIVVSPVILTAKNDGNANADWRFADAEIPGVKGSAYSYTEGSVVPTIEYNVKNDGVDEWIAVPASAYKLSYKEIVDGSVMNSDTVNSVSEVGSYRAFFADADSDDNFTLSTTWGDFSISDYKVFADVANTEWYYDEVYKAQDLKYMTGYAGTKLFGPTESLTRAQAVVVLYNMASGAGNTIAPSASYNKNNVYTTGFSDVDSDGANAWATYAIKWAKDTGITTGYGDGTFGVNDEITRAQFATMLARYAQLVKRYEAVEDADAILGDYTDAASVDEWFKDSVAWAVSEGVMGQNVAELNPNGSIERAQVAAMAVRFQPEAL